MRVTSNLPQKPLSDYIPRSEATPQNVQTADVASPVSTSEKTLQGYKGAFYYGKLPEIEAANSKYSVDGKTCRFLGLDTDAEWNSEANKPNQFITLQCRDFRSERMVSVLEHPSLGDGLLPSWQGLTPLPEILNAVEHRGQLPTGVPVEGRLRVRLSLFFSFGDVRAFFGGEGGATVARAIQKQCDQKRRINHQGLIDIGDYYLKLPDGKWYKTLFEIEDNCGLMGLGGLKDYAAKVGLELTDKGLMDEHKSNMLAAYRNPELFDDYVAYSAGDCVSEKLLTMFASKLNSEILPALDLRGYNDKGKECGESFDVETMPRTIGAITESLLRKFVHRKVLSNWEPGMYDNDPALEKYNAQHHLYPVAYDPDEDDKYVSDDWILGRASVKTIIDSVAKDTTGIFNLLVQGGRCKNEKSIDYRVEGVVADADISGCYGNGLMNQAYPVGLPTTIQHGFRENMPSLIKVLKRHEKHFVPGLWQLVIDVESLSFEQSLIFSKVISDQALYKLVKKKFEIEDPEVDVNFGLYTQQIANGIITHDILQALRAVMSDLEWGEFSRNAKVKAGMFYDARLRCNSAEEWSKAIAADPGKIICRNGIKGSESIVDLRSRKWFSFSLSEFIGPLLSTRKYLKKQRSEHSKDSAEWRELNAKQELFKLIINTTYGVLASPYFDSGNAVVANNITARARVLAWAMSVACGGIQSITDGSAYDINALRFRKKFMPGMDTLTKINRGTVNRNTLKDCIRLGPLGGSPWQFVSAEDRDITLSFGDEQVTGGDGAWPLVDRLYKEHIQQFFEGKEVDCIEQFDFEHKNIYAGIHFQSQSNYQFITFTNERKIKARGHSLRKERVDIKGNSLEEAAIKLLFSDLEKGYTRPYATEVTSGPLKVNQANEGNTIIEANGLLAGDSITKKILIQSISLSGFMWPTIALKKKWEQYNEFLKSKKGWGIDGVFYDPETGRIDYPRALREIQAAIDAGHTWIPGMKSESKIPAHPIWLEEQQYLAEKIMKKPAAERPKLAKLKPKSQSKAPSKPATRAAAASKSTGARMSIKPKGFGSPLAPAQRKKGGK